MNTEPDTSFRFAQLVADTTYDKLPPAAADTAKKSVLDTLGVTLAASGLDPAVRLVIDLMRENGGKPESTLLGFGGRLPAASAALANGAMAHCMDFDDRTSWGAHAGSALVPAVLAVAEHKGGVCGKDLITAVAVGQDIFVRLRCNVTWKKDWNLSTVMGIFAATAGACHVLGLNREQVANAFGIASMMTSGTMQVIHGGAHVRGMYAGFAASSAVQAAQLAAKGLTGIDGAFDGSAGLFQVFFDGKVDREQMLDQLGHDFPGAGMAYKPWPVVGLSHTYIHATIELMKEHRLAPADIEQIRVFVGQFHQQMCQPLERRRTPETSADAKFSLPFSVALAAVHGQVRLSDFTADALQAPVVLAMAARVVPVEDSSAEWTTKSPEGRVQIVTADGRSFERLGTQVPGSADAPLAWDDLTRKFLDCAACAAVPLGETRLLQVVDTVKKLETVADVSELMRLLA
jgi:2-methylcitrate dehydratase PrpD